MQIRCLKTEPQSAVSHSHAAIDGGHLAPQYSLHLSPLLEPQPKAEGTPVPPPYTLFLFLTFPLTQKV